MNSKDSLTLSAALGDTRRAWDSFFLTIGDLSLATPLCHLYIAPETGVNGSCSIRYMGPVLPHHSNTPARNSEQVCVKGVQLCRIIIEHCVA